MSSTYLIAEVPLIELPFIFATSERALTKAFSKSFEISLKEAKEITDSIDAADSLGYCDLLKTTEGAVICGFLVVKRKTDINTIAHEATHLAVKALDWASIEYDVDNHEILAYTIGWIVETFKKPWKN